MSKKNDGNMTGRDVFSHMNELINEDKNDELLEFIKESPAYASQFIEMSMLIQQKSMFRVEMVAFVLARATSLLK